MKKVIAVLMLLSVCLSVSSVAYGKDKVCGEAVNTDIKAYVNGAPIKSYNIDGWTGVVAEDLRDYGFVVEWVEDERRLNIGKDYYSNAVTSDYQFETNDKPIGSHAAYIYETDIKTYIYGIEVDSFNIGGKTIIYIDELGVFGDVVWDEEKREISYTYREPWDIVLSPGYPSVQHEGFGPYKDGIKSMSATFIKNDDGKFDIAEQNNLDHISWVKIEFDKRYGGLQFGFSMIAHHMLADGEFSQLCSDMVTLSYDGTRRKENAGFANQHTKIFINDIPVHIKEVRLGMGNNHRDYYFLLDIDMPRENINKLTVECVI